MATASPPTCPPPALPRTLLLLLRRRRLHGRRCRRGPPGRATGSGSRRWAPGPAAGRVAGRRAALPQAFLNGCGRGACGARSTWSPGRPPWRTATSCRPYAGTARAPDPPSCRSRARSQLQEHRTGKRAVSNPVSMCWRGAHTYVRTNTSVSVRIWMARSNPGMGTFPISRKNQNAARRRPIIAGKLHHK